MRTLKMFIIRWKACIKKPYVWAFIVIALATSLIPAVSSQYQSKTKLPIGLVNEDTGTLSDKLEAYIAGYSDDISIFKSRREQALRSLAMGHLEAVFIINDGFSEKVSQGDYQGIVTLFTAPASSAAQTLNEVVLNSGLSVWMEEKALLELDIFLAERGITISGADRQEVRETFDILLKGNNSITVERHIPAPPETAGGNDTFLSASAWYAAFSSLFVIVSAGWVIDTRRRALGERMRSAGIRPISAYAGSALAIIALTMIGWILAQLIVSILLHTGANASLRLLPPVLLYMGGLVGLTITISSLTSKTVQLMLIAPVFAVTQGVLCGMLLKLPGWAGTLTYLADALPGRWFMLAGDAMLSGGNPVFVLDLAVCSLAWLAVGTLAVALSSRERKMAREFK
jgi:hypothetical protein